jgi:hypothetical protein
MYLVIFVNKILILIYPYIIFCLPTFIFFFANICDFQNILRMSQNINLITFYVDYKKKKLQHR